MLRFEVRNHNLYLSADQSYLLKAQLENGKLPGKVLCPPAFRTVVDSSSLPCEGILPRNLAQ